MKTFKLSIYSLNFMLSEDEVLEILKVLSNYPGDPGTETFHRISLSSIDAAPVWISLRSTTSASEFGECISHVVLSARETVRLNNEISNAKEVLKL